ncbi:MAG: phosphate/phosphite/phosphonate ABC transporter substrate-binding protein [Gammaproteobacteria bacterium]|nr:phosphate/phosphite/phosphonate ABC transporter substrate-binding protein [Gammaproteobacteria bacterium]
MTTFARILALSLLATLLGSCCAGDAVDERGWPRQLVLGLVPANEAEAMVDNLQPLSDYLQARLGIPVRAFVPQDYTGVVEAMGSGRADIGMLPPFASMLGMRRYGLEPVLISVRNGETGYRSQWMTSDRSLCPDEPVADARGMLSCNGSLESIRGRSVAFTDPNSTSGFLFPSLQLIEAGMDPERDLRRLFVGAHDAAVLAAYGGDVSISVSYDDARGMVRPQYPDVGERVIVFAHSPRIPNDGVLLRGNLPADLKAAIAEAFVALAEDQQALPREERVLWVLYEIDNFVPASPGVFDPVAAAYDLLRR